MNYTFIHILTRLLNAVKAKESKISVKFSKQNFLFLKYLLNQGFITAITKKNNTFIVFLKYETFLIPSLIGSSTCFKRNLQKSKNPELNKRSNFIVNLFENGQKNRKLLARFR